VYNVCRMYVADNGSLIIMSAVEADAAVYQCFAVNSAGETSATVLLTVFGLFYVHFTVNTVSVVHSSAPPFSRLFQLNLDYPVPHWLSMFFLLLFWQRTFGSKWLELFKGQMFFSSIQRSVEELNELKALKVTKSLFSCLQ